MICDQGRDVGLWLSRLRESNSGSYALRVDGDSDCGAGRLGNRSYPEDVSLTRSVLAGVFVGLALTACGGSKATTAGAPAGNASGDVAAGSTATATGGSGGGSARQPTCAIAPASLVNATLGTDVGDPEENDGVLATVCDYIGASAGHMSIRVLTHEDVDAFAKVRAGFDS